MLSRFAFKKAEPHPKSPTPIKEQQPVVLHSDDFLCPSSIELEEDVTSVRTSPESVKAFTRDVDAQSPKSESAAAVRTEREARQEAWCRAVPEGSPRMTVLQFVDLVTVMRPKDVCSPINATLIAHITQLGLGAHSFRTVCSNCHQSRFRMHGKEGATCMACRRHFATQQFGQEVSFNLGMMDGTGELHDLRIHGCAASELLHSQRDIECVASSTSSLRSNLLFNQAVFQVRAVWSETLRQPVVEFVSASLIHA